MAQPSSSFSFSTTRGPNDSPFTLRTAAAAAETPRATAFSFGSPPTAVKVEPTPAPKAFSFGSYPASGASSAQQTPPPTSQFGGGFGLLPSPSTPSAFGTGFGGGGSQPSLFGAAHPSGFGGGTGFSFGSREPAPAQATGFSFGGGGSAASTAPPPRPAEPSTAAAADAAKPLVITSFGAEVKPADLGRPHPASYQVPPTSTSFSTPAPSGSSVTVETTQARAEKDVASTATDKKTKTTTTKKKKAVNALAVDEDEGSVEFPSRDGAEFRYRLTLTKSDRIKLWLEDRRSKHQWESAELKLSEIVTKENAIPEMELKDYFESFKGCLAGPDSCASHASSRDLVSLDKNGEVQLELSVAIVIFAKVLKPTYQFKLQPVAVSEMDMLHAKVRDQDEEIKELRDEVDELRDQLEALTPVCASHGAATAVATSASTVQSPAVFLRAVTNQATTSNQTLVWNATDIGGAFSVEGNLITGFQSGVYCVQVVVHHTNSYDPNTGNLFFRPPQHAAFQLQKNGLTVALAHGASPKGTLQSTAMHHMLSLNQYDVLKVHYTGQNYAKDGSYIIIYMLK